MILRNTLMRRPLLRKSLLLRPGSNPAIFVDPAGQHINTTISLPTGYSSSGSYPLILALHHVGAGTNDDPLDRMALASLRTSCLVLTPIGTSNGVGEFWNSGPPMNLYGSTVDDVAYLTWLIQQAIARYPVNLTRVYVVGYSNGGFMAHRLAATRPDLITAIVTGGGCFNSLNGSAFTPLASPVHVLQVHGTPDGTVPYVGDEAGTDSPANYPAGAWPGAEATAAIWATMNGGGTKPGTPTSTSDMSNFAGPDAEVYEYTGTVANGAIALIKAIDAGHSLALNDNFRTYATTWLTNHPRV